MSYDYDREKGRLLSVEGMLRVLETRRRIARLTAESGACLAVYALGTGDSWGSMAAVDFLVESGEFILVDRGGRWQDNVLISPRRA